MFNYVLISIWNPQDTLFVVMTSFSNTFFWGGGMLWVRDSCLWPLPSTESVLWVMLLLQEWTIKYRFLYYISRTHFILHITSFLLLSLLPATGSFPSYKQSLFFLITWHTGVKTMRCLSVCYEFGLFDLVWWSLDPSIINWHKFFLI